jgi:hypothetical protein
MSTIELPDDVAAALAAAAARRGVTEAELIAELVGSDQPKPAGLDGFLGCMDSGDPDWAATDTAELRKAADAHRSA